MRYSCQHTDCTLSVFILKVNCETDPVTEYCSSDDVNKAVQVFKYVPAKHFTTSCFVYSFAHEFSA